MRLVYGLWLFSFCSLSFLNLQSAQAQSPGDFVISEFMADPADVTDDLGEYVEILNISNMTIDINGCEVTDGTGATTADVSTTTTVPPGGFIVFGKPDVPGRDITYSTGSFGLNNTGDNIIFRCAGSTIAQMSFGPVASGTAYELNNTENHSNGSTSFSNYAASTTILNYDGDPDTDLGSPGSAGNTILPIDLLEFTGQRNQDHISLHWTTAVEINNDFMAIERSTDGVQFSEIGKMSGAGTTSEPQYYAFTDRQPVTGTNYYRLRQVDFDGATTYHSVIAVEFTNREDPVIISLYPTVVDQTVRLRSSHELNHPLPFRVHNLSGQLVLTGTLSQTDQEIAVHQLGAGPYFLRLILPDQTPAFRFIKQ